MARRIYIKDGGLNTSPTIPPGYTALGSDSGFLKTKVVDAVSDIGGGAVGGFEDITYNDLYTKVVGEQLTVGQWYRLTDYKSVNFLNGLIFANNNTTPVVPSFNPREVVIGETEVLLLQAISSYEISPIGYSETFSQDIVTYLPLVNKIGVNLGIANGNTLPDSSTVSGFDLQWDGTNVYFDMPTGYPAHYGHYFYLYAEFLINVLSLGKIQGLNSSYNIGSILSSGNWYNVPLTGGTGTGSTANINSDGSNLSISISNKGLGYTVGDLLSVDPLLIGGNTFNSIEVGSLITTESYYQQGTYEPLSPNGICQYPLVSFNQEKNMSRIKLENGGTKVVLLDLVEQDYLNYNISTLYVDHIQALDDAYGWITRRQDTQNRIDVPFDFRWVKYRRYECEVLGDIKSISYSATGTTSAAGATASYNNLSPNSDTSTDGQNAAFNVTVSSGVVTDVLIKNSGRLYANGDTLTIDGTQIGGISGDDDVVITVNGLNSNIGYWGIGDVFNGANTTGSDNYIDRLSIDWTKCDIYNLEIDGQGGADTNYYNGFCENNVFLSVVNNCKIGNYFQNNTIIDCVYNNIETQFYGNTIFSNFGYNTIGDAFYQNTIGNNFYNNTIGFSFQYNTIGDSFQYNAIGDNTDYNTIGVNFNFNTTVNAFQSNTIGDEFRYNTIGDVFNSNTIVNDFQWNTIKYIVSTTDFSLATHVYADYNCEIFRRSDSTLRLSYIDGSDTIQYTAITA